MKDLLFSIIFSLVVTTMLVRTLMKRKTVDRGYWRPSVGRDEALRTYWAEVVWMAIFALMTFALVVHFAMR